MPAQCSVRTIVVDALNFMNRFIPIEETGFEDAHAPELFAEAAARVQAFSVALALANVNAILVFDNGQATEEAFQKWLERRQIEVELGVRRMPASSEILLMSLFEKNGFQVLFPAGIDGDDAVACMALKLGCHILSRDMDMMRYGLPPGRVLSDFAIRGEAITFQVRTNETKASPRDVSSIHCDVEDWKAKGSTLQLNAIEGKIRRGNADSHTRALGNLHALVRPLRAALYARLNIPHVEETLPAWRNGNFLLEMTRVKADSNLVSLLDNPGEMYEWIRRHDMPVSSSNDDSSYDDRIHASAMAAAEIHDAAIAPDHHTSSYRIAEIYESLTNTLPIPSTATPGWCAGGRCAGLSDRRSGMHQPCLGDGSCFPMQIETAKYRGKDPLCQVCLTRLFQIIEAAKQRRGYA